MTRCDRLGREKFDPGPLNRDKHAPDGSAGHAPARGKLLAVKQGYNPNSSSVGSQISSFLAFTMASGGVTVTVLMLLNTFDKHLRKKFKKQDPCAKDREME
ncbi:MAG: hypothetical protein MI799_11980 [Desulfobacterales bacterium]|nr:hypothetical protein [Desulfobacterales bacterium]